MIAIYKRIQNKCEYPSLTKGFEPEVTFGVGLKGEISLEILSEDLASTTLENSIMVIISEEIVWFDLIKHKCHDVWRVMLMRNLEESENEDY